MAAASAEASEGSYENPYMAQMQKTIRSINKKLTGMHKTDAVIAENPGVSLDDLVKQKRINQDQKASALKKPQLQAEKRQLEEQLAQYKKFDADYQQQLLSQKEGLTAKHAEDLEGIKAQVQREAATQAEAELKKKLLVLSQFLRAAAAKRNEEEEANTDENKAFEGALLLVYGGDQKAVDTALSLIEGSDEQVPSIEGSLLPVKYSQIKQASVDHAPVQVEPDAWVDQVADTQSVPTEAAATANGTDAASDPTIANAGLTELDATAQTNGTHDTITSPVQTSTNDTSGNAAGDRWDTATGADKSNIDDSFEIVPRPNDEVDTPTTAPPAYTDGAAASQEQPASTSWADDAQASAGNTAGEAWDTKAAGQESTTDGWTPDPTATPTTTNGAADDGFSEVPNRHRGRGGFRGGRGDGEFRGRGRGGRGRGGGFRGGRGADGEFRGRGGRGRGPRGDAPPRS